MNDKFHFVVAVIIGITVPCIIGSIYLNSNLKKEDKKIQYVDNPLFLNGETELRDVPLKLYQEKKDGDSTMNFEVTYIGDSSKVLYSLYLSNVSYSKNISKQDIIWSLKDESRDRILKRGTIEEIISDQPLLSDIIITPGDVHKYELAFYLSSLNVEYSSGNLSLNLSIS